MSILHRDLVVRQLIVGNKSLLDIMGTLIQPRQNYDQISSEELDIDTFEPCELEDSSPEGGGVQSAYCMCCCL